MNMRYARMNCEKCKFFKGYDWHDCAPNCSYFGGYANCPFDKSTETKKDGKE